MLGVTSVSLLLLLLVVGDKAEELQIPDITKTTIDILMQMKSVGTKKAFKHI